MRNRVIRSVTVLIPVSGSCAALSAATALSGRRRSTPPVAEHRVDVPALTVGTTDLESTLQISGNLVPQTRVAILAKLPGTLSRVAVQIGDPCRAARRWPSWIAGDRRAGRRAARR
jgi:multidrug efflux pump subunit AcrA (membrane-fusion protein)